MPGKVTAMQFVEIWQKAKMPEEVVKATGISWPSARQRAYYYRRKGVPLQYLRDKNRERKDWEAMAALAKDLAPKIEK